jgi:putative DNA-invertase from lambdoid prophage Rac
MAATRAEEPVVSGAVKAAIWFRVSTDKQEAANQAAGIGKFAAHHCYEVVKRYEIADSAWQNGNGKGAEYRAAINAVLDAAHKGEFSVLVVWALDRITREGAEGALRLIRQLRERGCTLVSVQESWLNGSPEIQDVLVAFAGWMAQQESSRRSERIKAGLARRKAEGMPVGRVRGATDKKQRRRSGYVAAWEDGGKRRAAREATATEKARSPLQGAALRSHQQGQAGRQQAVPASVSQASAASSGISRVMSDLQSLGITSTLDVGRSRSAHAKIPPTAGVLRR